MSTVGWLMWLNAVIPSLFQGRISVAKVWECLRSAQRSVFHHNSFKVAKAFANRFKGRKHFFLSPFNFEHVQNRRNFKKYNKITFFKNNPHVCQHEQAFAAQWDTGLKLLHGDKKNQNDTFLKSIVSTKWAQVVVACNTSNNKMICLCFHFLLYFYRINPFRNSSVIFTPTFLFSCECDPNFKTQP